MRCISKPQCSFSKMCGNFGLLLLASAGGNLGLPLLKEMCEVTMMRGAQSAGVVTYMPGGSTGAHGKRSRVLNSKRSDLSDLIAHKLKRTVARQSKSTEPVFYCGHTRFATSSLTTLDGCHPHQWTSPSVMSFWDGFRDNRFSSSRRTVENFITHNGDFDAFTVGTHTYDLSAVQAWLQRVLWTPMPSTVDSAVVAGLVDLLRTQGLWTLSVRYAFVFAGGHEDLDYDMPSLKEIEAVAHVLEAVFEAKVVTESVGSTHRLTGCC